jgi:hypothetical protein
VPYLSAHWPARRSQQEEEEEEEEEEKTCCVFSVDGSMTQERSVEGIQSREYVCM